MNVVASHSTPGEHDGQGSAPAPASPRIVVPPTTSQVVARAVAGWRRTLADRAGASSLADVNLLGEAVLELTHAHPSGVAQLFAGRTTALANLFREGVSLPTARRRARAVAARATEQTERFGIAPTFLAIGVASWTVDATASTSHDDVAALARIAGSAGDPADDATDAPAPAGPRTVHAPVLLRPVRLAERTSGDGDFEIGLEPTAELNPFLARALRARGALLDPTALAASAFDGGGFDPRAVTERIHALGTAVLPGFELVEKLLVGSFVHPGQALVDDLDALVGLEHNDLVVALAHLDLEDAHLVQHAKESDVPAAELPDDAPAAAARIHVAQELPPVRLADEDPADERGVGDLDRAQRHALDAVTSGRHVLVDAPAGADVAGTITAILADAAASGRSVLYVPGHRRAAEQVLARMTEHGIDDLVLDIEPSSSWRAGVSRRLLAAMTLEPPYVDRQALGRTRADLIDTRRRLAGYMRSLHLVRAPWDVSAYDVLQSLARLTAERPSPSTHVRLDLAAATALRGDARLEAADDLVRASELGAFMLRPGATPWFGADLVDDDAAADALARAARLADSLLPTVLAQVEHVRRTAGLVEPRTVREWGDRLTMLDGLRTTLDVFQPMIFERTAAGLVAATADARTRRETHDDMTALQRRRLVKQAKDMLRPGTRVPDLHAALVEVQAQREAWTAVCPGGGWPILPDGLADMEQTWDELVADLDALAAVLATTPAGADLLDTPLDDLVARLRALADDREALDHLPERTRLVRSLAARGLGDLVTDLRDRRVDVGLVVAELELAWWATAFEAILAEDRSLAIYDGAGLEDLAQRFRALDRAHVAGLPGPVLVAALSGITLAVRRHPDDAEELFAELLEGRFGGLRDALDRYPALVRALRPVVVASPTLVPHVMPPSRTVDLVVLDAVHHLPLDALLPAIARARQVVVVGDPRRASGTGLHNLARLLPSVTLTADVSARDQDLVELLARHGYDGVLRTTPLPVTRELVTFEDVAGAGVPAADGTVLTTQAEVARVVEMAVEHALVRPEESLAIITLSATHAERVREALHTEVRRNPALTTFFSAEQPEPVVVADMTAVAGLVRDAVILSVGFGRTPHGRVLHRFGAVAEPTGEAMLLDALAVSRARLDVIASFSAADLDPERLRAPGTRLLAGLLELAERRTHAGPTVRTEAVEAGLNPDRLVIDLAERLWRAGLLVETDFGVPGGERIPLVVGHPDLPERMLVAVLTDDDAYIAEESVRVRDRQRAEHLERLGWTVVQVWSAAAFLDPVKEANRIRTAVLDAAAALRQTPLFGGAALGHTTDELAEGVPTPAVAGAPVGAGASGAGAAGAGAAAGASGAEAPTAGTPASADGTTSAPENATGTAGETLPRPTAASPSATTPDEFIAAPYEPGALGATGASAASARSGGTGASAASGTSSDSAASVGSVASSASVASVASSVSITSALSGASTVSGASALSTASAVDAADDVVAEPRSFVRGPRTPGSTPGGEAVLQGGFAMVGGMQPDLLSSLAADDPDTDRPARPAVQPGLPISAYGDNDLDALARWIASDGIVRDEQQLAGALRAELGVVRRSNRVDAAVSAAVRRLLGR